MRLLCLATDANGIFTHRLSLSKAMRRYGYEAQDGETYARYVTGALPETEFLSRAAGPRVTKPPLELEAEIRRSTRLLENGIYERIFQPLFESGFQVGLLSNESPAWQEERRRVVPWIDRFSPSVVSGPESRRTGRRLMKPEPEIFLHFLKLAGRRAEEVVFVDDTVANCVAAAELGFCAVCLRNQAQARVPGGFSFNAGKGRIPVLGTIEELAAHFRDLGMPVS